MSTKPDDADVVAASIEEHLQVIVSLQESEWFRNQDVIGEERLLGATRPQEYQRRFGRDHRRTHLLVGPFPVTIVALLAAISCALIAVAALITNQRDF